MIHISQQTTCKVCGKPLVQRASRRGHRKRLYCDGQCKQVAYRQRKEQSQDVAIDEQAQARIAELEQEVRTLQARLDLEGRFRTDVAVHHFKSWLRRHPQPEDSTFARRFLDDTRLPHQTSRSMYEARLRQHTYSDEDIFLFRDAWRTMLLNQSSPNVTL